MSNTEVFSDDDNSAVTMYRLRDKDSQSDSLSTSTPKRCATRRTRGRRGKGKVTKATTNTRPRPVTQKEEIANLKRQVHQLQNQVHGPGENRSVSVLSVPSAPSVVTVTNRGPVHSRLGSCVPERVVLRAPGHHSASIKHSDLPAVSSQMQAKLAKLSEHVDLNDLLPTNRANLVELSSSSARANDNQKEPISSFAGWVHAFSVFALHR